MRSSYPSYPSSLKARTEALILKRIKVTTFRELSKQTGISTSWLHDFAHGKLKLADVGKVQKLYEFLTNKKLEI